MTTKEMILAFFKERRKERKTKFTREDLVNYTFKKTRCNAETCMRNLRQLKNDGKVNYEFVNNTYNIKK